MAIKISQKTITNASLLVVTGEILFPAACDSDFRTVRTNAAEKATQISLHFVLVGLRYA